MTFSLAPYRRVVVLTGTGISAASGLSTYRGPDGLWNDADIAERATADALALRPHKVWELIDGFRTAAGRAEPNAAHRALAAWEAWLTEAPQPDAEG